MLNIIKYSTKKVINNINKLRVSNSNLKKKLRVIGLKNNPNFIFPSPSVPWGYLFQRPQQLARVLAKQGNHVFYSVEGEYKIKPDRNVIGINEIEANLYLYNDFRNGQYLSELNKIIFFRYWAQQINYGSKFNNKKIFSIYDWVDDISVYGYNDVNLNNHNELIKKSDLVITTAEKIFLEALKIRDDVVLLPNACDYDFFSNVIPIDWGKLDELREKYQTIIGYYGAIADWFDFELIEYCAKMNPNWLFLIVGSVYPKVQSLVKKVLQDNILFWNRVEYVKLPYLLSCFDVAIIPFIINEITQATSPVKIYEYMAGGKPVVSTNLMEVKKIKNVLTAQNKMEFNELLHLAIQKAKDESYINAIKAFAKENSWSSRANEIITEIKKRGYL